MELILTNMLASPAVIVADIPLAAANLTHAQDIFFRKNSVNFLLGHKSSL